jgi:hypothetical protein
MSSQHGSYVWFKVWAALFAPCQIFLAGCPARDMLQDISEIQKIEFYIL